MDWTNNDYWQKRKNNGMYKICFYTLSVRGNEKTHAIYERPTKEAADALITSMKGSWAKDKKGNYQYCWRLFNDKYECEQRGVY